MGAIGDLGGGVCLGMHHCNYSSYFKAFVCATDMNDCSNCVVY